MAPLRLARHCLLQALLCVAISLPAVGAGLVKVWGLDLSKWNRPEGNAGKFPVSAMSFSRDGKRIAISGTERREKDGRLASLLLVAEVGGGEESVRVFDILPGSAEPRWSPSGEAVLVNDLLISLKSGAGCSLPPLSAFVSADLIVTQSRGVSGGRSTVFTVSGTDCQEVRQWETPEEWYITDVSVERNLLLVNRPLKENLLVNPLDGSVLRRWSMGGWPLWDGPGGMFADSGRSLCNSLSLGDSPKGQGLRCWNVDNGELIGYAPADHAGAPFAVSAKSTRVVFSEYGYVPGLIHDWDSHPYRGAVVWDYAKGQKLASWQPESQTYLELGIRPPKKIVEPSKVAISPNGEVLAEGGNGRLVVYRIQP